VALLIDSKIIQKERTTDHEQEHQETGREENREKARSENWVQCRPCDQIDEASERRYPRRP
jgi:hypothetical protein